MTRLIAHELMTLGSRNPRIGIDWERRPSRYLTIDGVPAYQIAYSCGTCGLVLRREPDAPTGLLSATDVRDRLNAGLDGLDTDVIDTFAAQLPRGDYQVMLLDTSLRLPRPAQRATISPSTGRQAGAMRSSSTPSTLPIRATTGSIVEVSASMTSSSSSPSPWVIRPSWTPMSSSGTPARVANRPPLRSGFSISKAPGLGRSGIGACSTSYSTGTTRPTRGRPMTAAVASDRVARC